MHMQAEKITYVRKDWLIASLVGVLLGLALAYLFISDAASTPNPEHPVRKMFNTSENDLLAQKLESLEAETSDLLEELNRTRELIKLDKQARTKLTLLVNNLETENARLKEDLAFYQDFIPGPSNTEISLKRLQVTKDTVPRQYRYRALIVQGDKKPTIDLKIQVLVQYLREGKPDMMVFPLNRESSEEKFSVELKRFARIDGLFEIPEGTKLDKVEIRLMDNGDLKAQASVKL